MTEKEFFDFFIDKYVNETGQDIPGEMGYYLNYFMDNYPPEKLGLQISKKVAARIFHEFMINVLNIEDRQWQESQKLKDIYDCRVCSNAIAQIYDRGIMGVAGEGYFGLNDTFDKEQAEDIVNRFIEAVS